MIQNMLSPFSPLVIAVIKCQAHTSGQDKVAQGNRFADLVAKEIATKPLCPTYMLMSKFVIPSLGEDTDLAHLQALATKDDVELW